MEGRKEGRKEEVNEGRKETMKLSTAMITIARPLTVLIGFDTCLV